MATAYLKVENRLVTCPYDEAHKMKESRLQIHIAKCKLNHLDKPKETCPFNATHLYDISEREYHMLNCPDRAPLDRHAAQNMDKNNPFRGLIAVPSFSEPQRQDTDECWDDEISEGGPGYVPKGPPPGAIIHPPEMAKPSERKKLYKALHTMKDESSNVASGSQVPKPVSVPRQPKQPSETQRLQNAHLQQQNLQAVQTLGQGRGRPQQRIAAKFNVPPNEVSQSENNAINGIANVMNNLVLGRGRNPAPAGFMLDDDDEFPTLGTGRGAWRIPSQSPRNPGVKSD